jgi:hypothetical protein
MKFTISLVPVVLVAVLVGCTPVTITGSGNVFTQEEAITGFDKVDASHSFEVDISQGEAYSVIIRADDNVLPHLQVVKQRDTLKIGLKPGQVYSIRDATMQAEVTMPELTGLDLSGASQATITGFESAKDLSVDLSGSSSLRGDIEAGNAGYDVSGSSDVSLTGSGGDVTIDASGNSDVDLSDFPVADANIHASGSSRVIVNPNGRLDVDASGASDITYLGSPTMGAIDTSGSSTINPK